MCIIGINGIICIISDPKAPGHSWIDQLCCFGRPFEAVFNPSRRAQNIWRRTARALLALCIQKAETDQSPGLGFYKTTWSTLWSLSAENGPCVVLQSASTIFLCFQGWHWQQTARLCICICVGWIQGEKAPRLHNMHKHIKCVKHIKCIGILRYFCQVGWTKRMGPCSMSAGKTSKSCTWYQFHPSWENSRLSRWGTLGPFHSVCETSCTKLMGLPVTQSRARVMDADCGMSILGPYHGRRPCSIKVCKLCAWTEITQITHITQITQISQKLRRNYAEIT